MSYVNGTTHYNLPQTVGTDKRDWTDTNQAFAEIDSAIHTAVTTAETGATNIQALQADVNALDTRVTSAEADIATNTTNIGLINTKVNTIDADIADVRQDAEDMICAYNEATATSSHAYAIDDYFIYNDVLYKVTAPIAIGGTIVPNTNCKATNVTTEILSENSPSTGDVRFNNGILEYFNGSSWVEYEGGTNMFPTLDFTTPLHTFSTGNLTFTATKDCYLAGTLGSVNNTVNLLSINGTNVANGYYNDTNGVSYVQDIFYKLSSGDVVTITQISNTLHVFDVVS